MNTTARRPPSTHRSSGKRLKRSVAAVLLASALLVVPASADAQALNAQQVIGELNAQRAAHGIPASVVEDAAGSDGCRKHLAYLKANNTTGHDETPGNPGYTPEGRAAGNSSVLSTGSWGSRTPRNPYEYAPLHLLGVLQPSLVSTGVANDASLGNCMGIFNRNFAAPVQMFTYPGPGTQGWRYEETARENPFVPGDFVGLPQGTTTGPHLYAMLSGAEYTGEASMTLTGPAGPVDIRVVDRTTPTVGPYIYSGAIGVPARPLQPSSLYTASATVDVGGTPVSSTWQFTTAAAPPPPSKPTPSPGGAGGSSQQSGVTCSGRSKSRMTRRTLARTGVRVCPSRSGRLRFTLKLDRRTARRARLSRVLARGTVKVSRGGRVQVKLNSQTRRRLRGRSFTLTTTVNRGSVSPRVVRVRG